MSLKINYNVSAMIANNSLKLNDGKLSTALERLSSGYKINSAKDDAAGLAISRRMNAQIKGLKAASQDAKDGVSVIEIADGALSEVHDILQRMNELAVKAANGTLSSGQTINGEYVSGDRDAIQAEIAQLAEEIDRIGQTTEYNSQKLFTGEFDLKGYTNVLELKVDKYSDVMMYGEYEFKIEAADLEFIEDKDGIVSLKKFNGSEHNKVEVTRPDGKKEDYHISGDMYHLRFKGDDGDEFTLDITAFCKSMTDNKTTNSDETITHKFEVTDEVPVKMNLTGYGAMTFQIGANESQTLDIRFEKLSMETLGFKYQDSDQTKDMCLDCSTENGATRAIDQIKDAIEQISLMRSRLGAYQNRLEHTQTNLETSDENMTAAYSRIMDTDMAEEMSNYSNLQIVSQAATAILTQANERPSQMLQLLQ